MKIPLKTSKWPLGDLLITIMAVVVAQARTTTTRVATVAFEVLEDGPHKGKKFQLRYFLTDKAEWKFRTLAAACDAVDPLDGQADTDAMKGSIIRAEIRLSGNGEVVLIPRPVEVETA